MDKGIYQIIYVKNGTLSNQLLPNRDTTLNTLTFTSFKENFLGHSPDWYKTAIVLFLVINPIVYFANPYLAGWLLVLEFIFTLAMTTKCYPLQPGGLLAIEALALGMTTPKTVIHEVEAALPVILLLVFMVAGIYFMREFLTFIFTKVLRAVRSKVLLSFLFCFIAAVLSAFLDALTVMAVVIGVAVAFFSIFHKVASGHGAKDPVSVTDDSTIKADRQEELENFRKFLRSLVMHAAVGTALGGVCTTVGEPQNLLISTYTGWEFMEFFWKMSIVTMPVLVVGLITCVFLELTKVFNYGGELPESVRQIIIDFDEQESAQRTSKDKARLVVQAVSAIFLVFALAFHIAEVGLIGLTIIVLQTAFNGVTEEHHLGPAFEEALPFTALLVVFFAIVGVIHDLHLFKPVIDYVLTLPEASQPGTFYIANGLLSMISDNVFVATVYIGEVKSAFDTGIISRLQFDKLAIAINTGTNIPSVATPNGQAAFLFLLASSLSGLLRLGYGQMVVMALPYTITMGITGWACVNYLL